MLFSYDLNKETWILTKERTRQRLEDGKDFYCQTPFYTGIQPLYMVESYRYSVRYESMYMQGTIVQLGQVILHKYICATSRCHIQFRRQKQQLHFYILIRDSRDNFMGLCISTFSSQMTSACQVYCQMRSEAHDHASHSFFVLANPVSRPRLFPVLSDYIYRALSLDEMERFVILDFVEVMCSSLSRFHLFSYLIFCGYRGDKPTNKKSRLIVWSVSSRCLLDLDKFACRLTRD